MTLNCIPLEVQSCQIYYYDDHRVDVHFHWGLLGPINKRKIRVSIFRKIETNKNKNLSASNK